MAEMTKERAEILDLKRRLRDAVSERDRYLSKYVELLEVRSSGRAGCRHDYCERCGDRFQENTTHSCRRVTVDTASPSVMYGDTTETDHTWTAPTGTDGTTTTRR